MFLCVCVLVLLLEIVPCVCMCPSYQKPLIITWTYLHTHASIAGPFFAFSHTKNAMASSFNGLLFVPRTKFHVKVSSYFLSSYRGRTSLRLVWQVMHFRLYFLLSFLTLQSHSSHSRPVTRTILLSYPLSLSLSLSPSPSASHFLFFSFST